MTSFRRAAVVLALAAMMLRGLMPAGWMPNPAGAGESLFVICDMDQDMPAMGMNMSHMDMSAKAEMPGMPGMDMSAMDHGSSGSHSKHSMDGHQQACPFGAAPHVATPSILTAVLAPGFAAKYLPRLAEEQAAIHVAAYKPQSPRGPPSLI